MEGLREICDKNNILLIFDEIQCGLGRTGHWFAKDYYGAQPDILTLAKGLGGGMPIGALLCNSKVSDAIEFGDHGTTFGGNPLAAAAALATLKVIADEKLCAAAQKKGEWLHKEIQKLKVKYKTIKEVRGMGLMMGIQLDQPAAPIVQRLLEQGVIANATAESVLRLVPPLNIPKSDLELVINKIEKILKEKDESK